MKRAFLYLILAVFLLSGTVSALAARGPVLAVSSANAAPGESVTVTVDVSGASDVIAMEFWLCYNSETLELSSAVTGNALQGIVGGQAFISAETADRVFMQWDSTDEPMPQEGTVLELEFSVKEGFVGDTTLYMEENSAVMYNSASCPVTVSSSAGTVTVKKPAVIGDVNGDGTADLIDVSLLFNWWNGKALLNDAQLGSGDVNGDGCTDLVDAAALFVRCCRA